MKHQPFNRRRQWLIRYISVLSLLLGISLLLYPVLSRLYTDHKLNQLIEQWEFSQSTFHQDQRIIEEYVSMRHVLDADRDELHITEQDAVWTVPTDDLDVVHFLLSHITQQDAADLSDESANDQQQVAGIQPIGMLYIDKIDLQLPVVNGATQSNLKYAAARIEGTGQLGEVGNAAVAAHRSLSYGRFFNRLNELVVGDKIRVEKGGQQIEYEVFRVHVVEPTDLSVLNRNDSDRILTLITCDPIEEATHRLVVHAVANE